MRIGVINQMYGKGAFSSVLKSSIQSATSGGRLRVLSAFVKLRGLSFLQPELDSFLIGNGRVEWIIGMDCGGTSGAALQYLDALSNKYPGHVDIKIFSARDQIHVFHPKLFLLDYGSKFVAWLGSSNLTAGGMYLNCECMVEFQIDKNTDSKEAALFESLWDDYSKPSAFLIPLTADIISETAIRHGPEQLTEAFDPPPHPLRPIIIHGLPKLPDIPRLTLRGRVSIKPPPRTKGNEMIMQILHETRSTQVQIPVKVLENYFGVRNGDSATISLQYREGNLTEPAKSTAIIYPTSHVRIEMRRILGLRRPLIVTFQRVQGKRDTYEYEIWKNGTPRYERLRKLLINRGQRTARTSRLYLIR